MKKTIFLCLLVLSFSCSNEDFSDEQNNQQNLKKGITPSNSCGITLVNPNPISTQTVTVSHDYPLFNGGYCNPNHETINTPCFVPIIKNPIAFEIWERNLPFPHARVTTQVLVSNDITFELGFEYIPLTDYQNVYPYLTVAQGRMLYEEIVCRVQFEIDGLQQLPNNQTYSVDIEELSVDYIMSLDTNASDYPYVIMRFDIYKNNIL